MLILGHSPYRATPKTYTLAREDRLKHIYLIGKSGSGKTTLLENLLAQDLLSGQGVALLDPHGDLAERALALVPKWRRNEVIYFNPKDRSHPIALNVLACREPSEVSLTVEGIISAFKHIWFDSWGPRLEYILTASLGALLYAPNTTLLALPRFLTNDTYREHILRFVKDPLIKQFFYHEFDSWSLRLRHEAILPVQNKLGSLLLSQPIRAVIGQVKNSFEIDQVMNSRQIFIANLSKGQLGMQSTHLLGALLISQFQQAALRRSQIPEALRRDFFIYVDEVQSLATRAFAEGLSELRKYHCSFTLAHQYIEQLSPEIKAAILGNVGTLISFTVGEADALALAKEFYPRFQAEDLLDLSRGEVIFKSSINGAMQAAERVNTLEPLSVSQANAKAIIRASRLRYGTPMRKVAKRLNKWWLS